MGCPFFLFLLCLFLSVSFLLSLPYCLFLTVSFLLSLSYCLFLTVSFLLSLLSVSSSLLCLFFLSLLCLFCLFSFYSFWNLLYPTVGLSVYGLSICVDSIH